MDQPAALPLDRAAMVRWLTSPQVVDERGRVWSWHNPAHPGYAYPEAGGLWLSLLAREPDADDEPLRRVASWLEDCEARNAIGRHGRSYLFDRGMVVAGRLAWLMRQGTSTLELAPAMEDLVHDLRAGRAASPPAPAERWSERFGPHLLKLALPCSAWTEQAPKDQRAVVYELLDALIARLPSPAPDGRVPTGADGEPTYLHAHCYAAEGLWALSVHARSKSTRARARREAERSAAWLAEVQRPDGGLPPWHDGARGWGPAPADVAAQAVRLWSGLDPCRHAAAIERALAFLARLSTPTGGLRYHEDCRDVNTWATLFGVQALDFSRGGADVRRLV